MPRISGEKINLFPNSNLQGEVQSIEPVLCSDNLFSFICGDMPFDDSVRTGKIPAFFRPPMGLTNPHTARALRRNGLICVGWDVRPFDTGRANQQVMDIIVRKTRNGSVILLHDTARSAGEMTELLEGVIAVLKERGFSFSALDDLLRIEPYQTFLIIKKTCWHSAIPEAARPTCCAQSPRN